MAFTQRSGVYTSLLGATVQAPMDGASWASRSGNLRRLDGVTKSSGSGGGRRASPRRHLNDGYRHVESPKGSLQATVIFHWMGRRYYISWMFPFTASILSMIILPIIDQAVRTTLCGSADWTSSTQTNDNSQRWSALRSAEHKWTTIGSPGTSTPYWANDDEITEWIFQLLEPTQNKRNPDRYERQLSCGRLLDCENSYRWHY